MVWPRYQATSIFFALLCPSLQDPSRRALQASPVLTIHRSQQLVDRRVHAAPLTTNCGICGARRFSRDRLVPVPAAQGKDPYKCLEDLRKRRSFACDLDGSVLLSPTGFTRTVTIGASVFRCRFVLTRQDT
eukprot:CAMPEP_0177674988 /NCGR_PEP_ID=MMETSP0447-20121125/26918_1 /TAXON_ID=0 /ORGANISM="Stygamoeba regulata, Strain BSH-02190019" /LENGTH=130 /DNA_ID=CAMNT_0019183259 /DNA_START=222 /DNA_END=613 /DNA_ORIENTATION=-